MAQTEQKRFCSLLAGLVAALTLAVFADAQAAGLVGARAAARTYSSGPAVTAVQSENQPGGAKIVFSMNSPVEASAYVLADPNRVIVDLPETAFLIDPSSGRQAAQRGRRDKLGLVSSFRFGHFAVGRSRIVVDLAGPARIVKAASEMTESGGAARLVVELVSTDPDSFRAAASVALLQTSRLPERAPEAARLVETSAVGKPVVVVDAGHGGGDVGAAAGKDAAEKVIVLDFARQLAAKLEKGGQVRALLTRSDDVFVPLGQRVKIARDAKASLFISLHADSLNEASVHGATVYTVSERASDAEAARVAAKENEADRAGGLPESEEVVDVSDILFDLTRRETRAMSNVFAQTLASSWKSAGDLNKNPVRSAGFVVLKAPDVPSVLLELGYLSNERDVAKLSSPEWREEAAAKVASAIERYLAARPISAADVTGSLGRRTGVDAPTTR